MIEHTDKYIVGTTRYNVINIRERLPNVKFYQNHHHIIDQHIMFEQHESYNIRF